MSSIEATVQAGGLIDAIRYALSANATNGKQRSREDMRRAYEVAVHHDMVQPTDSEAVSKLLRCSVRWARELTSYARAEETAKRNARIEALAREGRTQREIAGAVGVNQATVSRLFDAERNTSVLHHPTQPAPIPDAVEEEDEDEDEDDYSGRTMDSSDITDAVYAMSRQMDAPTKVIEAAMVDYLVDSGIIAAPREDETESPEVVHNHRAQGTGENEWYTPPSYLDAAREVLGWFDLDPASSSLANETVGAANFFTLDDNGLEQPWAGRVWLNPPYSQPAIAQFADKLASEWEAGNIESAIALTHNYTDTAWFHRLAGACSAICFTRGRIGFVNPEGKKAAPTQGQAFFYFGSRVLLFSERFKSIGFVVEVRNA
jgi:ParB family chromosome partitioning protein